MNRFHRLRRFAQSAGKPAGKSADRPAGRSVALPICMVLGVAFAFAVVVMWFPKGPDAWRYPLHQIDAPAHYYFIRRILDEGVGAATHLWPNDAYYPPLFHLLAAGLVAVSRLFGEGMTIYAAFNIVWITGAGLVWPVGMQLLASYWTCRGLRGSRDPRELAFPCVMALIVPLLSVASASHPFQMLASGPLAAYGLAFSILPFWLYATLRLLDAIAARIEAGRSGRKTGRSGQSGQPEQSSQSGQPSQSESSGQSDAHADTHVKRLNAALVRWAAFTVLTGVITVFAHPRMAFTWLLFIGPFLLLRMPWKLILAALAVCVVGAGAFFAYMVTHYKSGRYFNPGDWFHTFVPNRTVPDALRVFVTDNIGGPAGVVMAVAIVASVVVALVAIAGRVLRKDAIAVLLVTFLFALLYVCSTALTGWFPNIVAAAWYRAETRPLTMIPLAVVTLLVFAASALHGMAYGTGTAYETAQSESGMPSDRRPSRSRTVSAVMVAVLALLAVGAQFGGVETAPDGTRSGWGNATRAALAADIGANMSLTDAQPDEQLTRTKYDILADVARTVEPGAAVVSDPLNGSMYGRTAFDVNMLYPIYNPMAEKHGAIFGAVERAFDSGDGTTLLNTVCPISADKPEYFLVMGGQAPSLTMFTFRQQYDPFHRDDLIAKYVADGTLVKVRDYSDRADYARGWALYRFGCAS